MNIVSTEQMRRLEELSCEYGTDQLRLMENAGSAAAKIIARTVPLAGKRIVILCGKGNNGGDACVVARRLIDIAGKITLVFVTSIPSTKQSYLMYQRLRDTGVEILQADFDMHKVATGIEKADVLVDGVFGTGFKGQLQGKAGILFPLYNAAQGSKFSLDMPSGTDADTGFAAQDAIRADYTITFGVYKTGQFLLPARKLCGELFLADIAIPQAAYRRCESFAQLATDELAGQWLPKRAPDSNKGDFGKALLICGKIGMSGAAVLAAKAAMRSGAGLTVLATVQPLVLSLAATLTENTFLALSANEQGGIAASAIPEIIKQAQQSSAVLIGSGMGLCEDTRQILYALLESCTCPVIIDADGINALCGHINIVKTAKAPVILTPHPGEMARLCRQSTEQVQQNRMETAKAFVAEYGVTLVLKGFGTLVVSPQGKTCLNVTGNPGLAKGGSGDMLAGMICAFAAQGIAPYEASALAVYLHGMAADLCAETMGETAMLASDVIETLPAVLKRINR